MHVVVSGLVVQSLKKNISEIHIYTTYHLFIMKYYKRQRFTKVAFNEIREYIQSYM